MKISKRGIDLIKLFEGFRKDVYKDSVGKDTIGYGHLLKSGESFPNGVSFIEAENLLRKDLDDAEYAVNNSTVDKGAVLTQCEYDALVSLAFNIGGNSFIHGSLPKLLRSGAVVAAAAKMEEYCLAGGKRMRSLQRRRMTEVAFFLGGSDSFVKYVYEK